MTAHVDLTSVADPVFPAGGGGANPLGGGGADLRHVHFSVKMYTKTKEMDPVGGGGGRPPGSANEPCEFSGYDIFLVFGLC